MSNRLFVAWRSGDANAGRWGPVGVLERAPSGGYRFVYTHGARMLPGFHPFPGMPDLNEAYESDELFPMFANRLLNESRPEYKPSLVWSGFDPENPPDPIQLLGVTEGLRQTDSLEVFPCPAPDSEGCFVATFFLHGLRHAGPAAIERVAALKQDEELRAEPENDNAHDANAVGVWTIRSGELRIGYVPRYLARDFRQLYDQCGPGFAELRVQRVNGNAPLQQRLLCRLNACWPDDFQPCAGEEFRPIPSGLPLAG